LFVVASAQFWFGSIARHLLHGFWLNLHQPV
jgi:hypothetical protein